MITPDRAYAFRARALLVGPYEVYAAFACLLGPEAAFYPREIELSIFN